MTAGGKRILVIEDEPDMLRGLSDAMQFEGFAVTAARTGEEGLAHAKAERPHLIVLDLMLPDINGYRVCQEIREMDAQVPIIMLTARGQEADKIRGFEVGADDYGEWQSEGVLTLFQPSCVGAVVNYSFSFLIIKYD